MAELNKTDAPDRKNLRGFIVKAFESSKAVPLAGDPQCSAKSYFNSPLVRYEEIVK